MGLVVGGLLYGQQPAFAQEPCRGLGGTPIVCENARPGSLRAEWDIEGAGDPSIQGFATAFSVTHGEQVDFKVSTDAVSYRLDLYRVGYYGGLGARKVGTVTPAVRTPFRQPGCLSEPATGLIDCGNWTVTASWVVPKDALSGIYIARAVRLDTGGASHIFFVVRDEERRSAVLVQTSDTTWQAYNDYGGNSLYEGRPDGRAYKVSYNRPFVTRGNKYRRTFFWATEYPMIRWLEANGYDVSYTTGVDTDRDGAALRTHKVWVSLGHDEYWSAGQRANVTAARDTGVHLALFTGNTMFWKTRWEPSIDGTRTPYRTLVSYKETHAGVKIDPAPTSTGTWRDPRFGEADGGGRPENELVGTLFVVNCCRFDSLVVSAEEGQRRFWRQTELARMPPGASMTIGMKIVGAEWDSDVDNGHRPPGLFRVSSTAATGVSKLIDFGSMYRDSTGPVMHNMTMYKHPSGALVFSAGSMHWSWAFDAFHDDPDHAKAPTDQRIQQAAVNLFADMGIQPASLRPELSAATPSHDATPPVAVIDLPKTKSDWLLYRALRVSGTASDKEGVAAGVEVSLDGGMTWHPADGASHWRYSFTPRSRGPQTILARAVDDSGNLQAVPTWVTVEVIGFHRLAVQAAVVIALATVALVGGRFVLRRRGRIAQT
jgi:hypothetical protein